MTFRRQNSKLLFESPSVTSGEEPELKRFDFEFERKLGDGAFGQVWRVRHKKTSQTFALKQVPKEKVTKMLPQFRREVYIMYEINHPHIIKLYNHFEDEKFFYLIMELAEGNLFHKLYREKQFLERVASQYFREVLLAVEYLHSHIPAIIHRDIKPENILIDKEGRLKLTDFGWSNYYSSEAPTPRFTTCGTLEYLPPEMVEEKGHNTSADIWCLGILLYEMLIGSTPFKSTIRDQMLVNITSSKPKFPLTVPALAKDLISKMLEKDPSKRPSAIKIKEHQWITEHTPIRPTITQELQPKVLPDLETPKVLKGYVVINKNDTEKKDMNLENNENNQSCKENSFGNSPIKEVLDIPTVINPYRQSIKQIKDELESKNNETVKSRKMIQEKNFLIQKFESQCKKLEEKILVKKKELSILAIAEKDVHLELSDISIDLEKILKYYNSKNIHEKISMKSMDLMEKNSEFKRQQNYLNILKDQSKGLIKTFIEKEKILYNLQAQLKQIKNEMSSETKEKKSKIEDIKINQEVLKIRLNNKARFSKEFGKEEKKTAEEIKKLIINNISNQNCEKRLEAVLLKTQEKIIETEQKLSNLLFDYEEKRSEFIQKNRKKKEKLLKLIKKSQENSEKLKKSVNESDVENIKNEISTARKKIKEFNVPNGELEKNKLYFQEISLKLSVANEKIEKIQEFRMNNKFKKEKSQNEIEDIEMQIGILKSALLYKSQFSDI